MLLKEKQALQVFRRTRDFLKENAPDAGFGSVKGVVAQLHDTIAQLELHAREQEVRHRIMAEATQLQRIQFRSVVREFMRPLSRAARILFPSKPTLLEAFAMPDVRDYVGTIAAAEAMAQVALEHAEAFRSVGLPEDFVKRMQEAVARLRAQLDARAVEAGRRSAATAGLRREYLRGREISRMLDAMIAPRLAIDPARAAEWRSLIRFVRINTTADGEPTAPVDAPPSGTPTPFEGAEEGKRAA